MNQSTIIILVHGFFKNDNDMLPMAKHLTKLNYHTHAVNLPTTFGAIEDCYQALLEQLEALTLETYATVHLVGHSMGGLIIRYYLARHEVANLGRCVFIGTPNKGSGLADIGKKVPGAASILKPVEALHSAANEIPLPLNRPLPEIGVLAGDNHRLATGFLLKRPNDGRVEVEATKLDAILMKDFKVLPFVHTKIHDEWITAELVVHFLETGKFEST